MDNSDDEETTLDALIKRRKQLASIAEYHRKMFRSSTSSSSTEDIANQNQKVIQHAQETIPRLKTTSHHELAEQDCNISDDIIEDSGEEASLNQISKPNLTINSSSENDSYTSTSSNNKKYIDVNQISPQNKYNPNKVIKVLSTVIVKKPNLPGPEKTGYLGNKKEHMSTTTYLTTALQDKNNTITLKKQDVEASPSKSERKSVQTEHDVSSDIKENIKRDPTSNKTINVCSTLIVKRNTKLPSVRTSTDSKKIICIESPKKIVSAESSILPATKTDLPIETGIITDFENRKPKVIVISHEPLQQQLSKLPYEAHNIMSNDVHFHSESREYNLNATSSISFQEPVNSLPMASSSTDVKMTIDLPPENIEDKYNTKSCSSPKQHTYISPIAGEAPNISSKSPTIIRSCDAKMIVDSPTKNLEDIITSDVPLCDSPQQPSILPAAKICLQSIISPPEESTSATLSFDTKMIVDSPPENLEDKCATKSRTSPKQHTYLSPIAVEAPNTSSQSPTIIPSCDAEMIVDSPAKNLEDISDTTLCDSPPQPSILTAAKISLKSTISPPEESTSSNARVINYDSIIDDAGDVSNPILGKKTGNFDINQDNLEVDLSEIIGEFSGIINKRKRRKASSKRAFIDFLSDEDKEDFSSGSSVLWSFNESDSSSDEIQKKKKNKKKVKKSSNSSETINKIEKKQKPVNQRKINKKAKDEGKAHKNRRGETIAEKTMMSNPCVVGKCARGCYDIPEERRTALFEYYWSLEPQRRKDWIVRCAQKTPIKRRKKDSASNRRNTTYEYFITDGEGYRQVCQKFLMCTLDVTQKYIIYTLDNAEENMSKKDLRKPNIINKYTENAKTFAHNFIQQLPAVPSHYNRKRTTRTYLPQELKNIANLYRIYLNECNNQDEQALSEHMFRSIFDEYNVTFHVPKKDKCVTCVKAENNKEEMSEKDQELLNLHYKEKKLVIKRTYL